MIVDNTTKEGFAGFCVDLMAAIAKKKNFKVEYHASLGNKYGTFSEIDGPDGMIKELMENVRNAWLYCTPILLIHLSIDIRSFVTTTEQLVRTATGNKLLAFCLLSQANKGF